MATQVGMKIDSAIGASQGIRLVKERAKKLSEGTKMYSLVLLDQKMPNVDCLRIASAIKLFLTSQGIKLPFMCCCVAYSDEALKSQALAAYIDHFLVKPVTQNQLVSIYSLVDN